MYTDLFSSEKILHIKSLNAYQEMLPSFEQYYLFCGEIHFQRQS